MALVVEKVDMPVIVLPMLYNTHTSTTKAYDRLDQPVRENSSGP
jgi:hypothetical protein